MNPLRVLDEVVLPRLARGLSRIARAMARRPLLTGMTVLSLVVVGGMGVYLHSRPVPVDESSGDVVRVGAAEGDTVPAYLDQSAVELAGLSGGETVALVSFDSYVEPGALESLLAAVTPLRTYARVPLPGVQTEIVSFPVNTLAADVPAAMRRTAEAKDRAAKDADQAADVLTGDGVQEQELRAFYREDAKVNRAEAASYRQLCACVYSAVVRATPAALAELAKRQGVRVVDPAPQVKRLDRTVFLPLQPEQKTVVSPPVDTSFPSPTKS